MQITILALSCVVLFVSAQDSELPFQHLMTINTNDGQRTFPFLSRYWTEGDFGEESVDRDYISEEVRQLPISKILIEVRDQYGNKGSKQFQMVAAHYGKTFANIMMNAYREIIGVEERSKRVTPSRTFPTCPIMRIEGDLVANFHYFDNGIRLMMSNQVVPSETDTSKNDRVYGLGVHWWLTQRVRDGSHNEKYNAAGIINSYTFNDYTAEASVMDGPKGQGSDRGKEQGGEGYTYNIYIQPAIEIPSENTIVIFDVEEGEPGQTAEPTEEKVPEVKKIDALEYFADDIEAMDQQRSTFLILFFVLVGQIFLIMVCNICVLTDKMKNPPQLIEEKIPDQIVIPVGNIGGPGPGDSAMYGQPVNR